MALTAGDPAGAVSALVEPLAADDPPDVEAHRLRALAAAAVGDQRIARAYALRTLQLDPGRWDALTDTGLVLCRSGRTREGCRLLQRAAEAAEGDRRAELALAQGLAMAGRLRDAVAALDRATGRTRAGLARPS
jgi:Tfp pilus assembly protein PilF